VSHSSQRAPSRSHNIDPTRERLIALARFGSWYEQRTGRRLDRTVVYRWRRRGMRTADGARLQLPTVQLGGVRYTSEEAIAWWSAALDGGVPA
jgi:hypothetical protein